MQASSHDKTQARNRLQNFTQRPGQSFEAFVTAFEDQRNLCLELLVDMTNKEVVTWFISGLDPTIYGNKARELLENVDNDDVFPANVIDAKEVMLQVKAANEIIRERNRRRDQSNNNNSD